MFRLAGLHAKRSRPLLLRAQRLCSSAPPAELVYEGPFGGMLGMSTTKAKVVFPLFKPSVLHLRQKDIQG